MRKAATRPRGTASVSQRLTGVAGQRTTVWSVQRPVGRPSLDAVPADHDADLDQLGGARVALRVRVGDLGAAGPGRRRTGPAGPRSRPGGCRLRLWSSATTAPVAVDALDPGVGAAASAGWRSSTSGTGRTGSRRRCPRPCRRAAGRGRARSRPAGPRARGWSSSPSARDDTRMYRPVPGPTDGQFRLPRR